MSGVKREKQQTPPKSEKRKSPFFSLFLNGVCCVEPASGRSGHFSETCDGVFRPHRRRPQSDALSDLIVLRILT
jgi:hypothetical protein